MYFIIAYIIYILQIFYSRKIELKVWKPYRLYCYLYWILKMFGKLPVSFHNIRYIKIFRISFFRWYQITKVYHYMHLKLLYLILLPLLKNKISSTSCRNMISLISIYYCEQCSIQNFNGDTFLQYIAILLKIY